VAINGIENLQHSQPKVLVLQHIAIEHPGIFRSFLAQDGIAWDTVELDEDESIPALDNYAALWVMGGPMDVWQVAEYPWLTAEKSVIREAVAQRRMPYLGLCLGHQLLAEALGGEVGPSAVPEIGILDVHLTAAGKTSELLKGIPATSKCLQWHSAEVTRVPATAEVLAATQSCAVQALSINGNALGLQFHLEITPQTVSQWAQVPEYQCALERAFGAGALPRIEAQAAAHMETFNRCARMVYDNWKSRAFD